MCLKTMLVFYPGLPHIYHHAPGLLREKVRAESNKSCEQTVREAVSKQREQVRAESNTDQGAKRSEASSKQGEKVRA